MSEWPTVKTGDRVKVTAEDFDATGEVTAVRSHEFLLQTAAGGIWVQKGHTVEVLHPPLPPWADTVGAVWRRDVNGQTFVCTGRFWICAGNIYTYSTKEVLDGPGQLLWPPDPATVKTVQEQAVIDAAKEWAVQDGNLPDCPATTVLEDVKGFYR